MGKLTALQRQARDSSLGAALGEIMTAFERSAATPYTSLWTVEQALAMNAIKEKMDAFAIVLENQICSTES